MRPFFIGWPGCRMDRRSQADIRCERRSMRLLACPALGGPSRAARGGARFAAPQRNPARGGSAGGTTGALGPACRPCASAGAMSIDFSCMSIPNKRLLDFVMARLLYGKLVSACQACGSECVAHSIHVTAEAGRPT